MTSVGGDEVHSETQNAYYKVSHSGGLAVLTSPDLTSIPTGRIINCESIVMTNKNLYTDKNGDTFIEISEGGWVVVKKGTMNACIKTNGPDIKNGEWLYEVVHPSGSRFAKLSNISDAFDRHEKLHVKGTIIKGIMKKTDFGSVITMVQLEMCIGWIFEHAITGQVLDRLGNDLVVIPVDGTREYRYARLIALILMIMCIAFCSL
jgi:hypothetical protein